MKQLTTEEIQESAEKVMLGLNKEYGREIFKMSESSMNTIKQKIKEIGLSQRQISVRLGKNPTYLAGVMRSGLSTAKQAELLIDLEVVAKGDTVKSDSEVIAELSERLAQEQDWKEWNRKLLLETQKRLMEATKRGEAVTKLNCIFIVVIAVSLILWSVV